VKGVYIMNSKKIFKIEMENTEEANKFINSKCTMFGHIPNPYIRNPKKLK